MSLKRLFAFISLFLSTASYAQSLSDYPGEGPQGDPYLFAYRVRNLDGRTYRIGYFAKTGNNLWNDCDYTTGETLAVYKELEINKRGQSPRLLLLNVSTDMYFSVTPNQVLWSYQRNTGFTFTSHGIWIHYKQIPNSNELKTQ